MKKFTFLMAMLAFLAFHSQGQETFYSVPAWTGSPNNIDLCEGGSFVIHVDDTDNGHVYNLVQAGSKALVQTLNGTGGDIQFDPVTPALGNTSYTINDATDYQTVIFTTTVVVQPTAPTMTKSPDVDIVSAETVVSATVLTSGSGGVSCNNTYAYSTDFGTSWSSYTPGTNISTAGLAGIDVIQIMATYADAEGRGCSASNIYKWTVDDTDPIMESVLPAEGLIVLAENETFILTVDASDDNLYSLEVDHSMESTIPEFSVYASETDPYGGNGAAFLAAGVTVTYDGTNQVWEIDFGTSVSDDFVTNGGITFYLVLEDFAGNEWGSMSPTTPANTFVYEIDRDINDPVLESVTPDEGLIVLAENETFILTVDASDANLYSLEVDHSMEGTLPEFTVYASETDPYGGDEGDFIAAGVSVDFDATDQVWTIDFGQTITDAFITNGGITFYLVLHDLAGNTWGSMSPTTPANTFVYQLDRDINDPILESASPAEGLISLAVDEPFIFTVDASDAYLYSLEIDHSMEGTLPEFTVYASETDPYGGDEGDFIAAGVSVDFDETDQVWTINFGQTVTDAFIANGGITFYLVLQDLAGNTWGSMSPTTPANTFVYTLQEIDIHNIDQDTYYLTIQSAIDDANAGETIQVAAGTYIEDVAVNESVTIIGAGATTIIQPTVPANPAFAVSVDDVTIQDLKITHPTILTFGVTLVTGATTGFTLQDVDITNIGGATAAANGHGIYIYNSFSDLTVTDCQFSSGYQGSTSRGIGIFAPKNLTLSGFDISGSTFEYFFVGIYLGSSIDGMDVTTSTFGPFELDDCTAAVAGIYIGDGADNNFNIENIAVTGNTFSNYGRGIYVWNYAANTNIDNFEISGNTFTNSIWSSAIRFIIGLNGMEDYSIDGDGIGDGINIDNNGFTQNSDIGANVALIDLRTYDANLLSCKVAVTDNDITFSGAPYTDAMYGIQFFVGSDGFYNTTVSDNVISGGNTGGIGNPVSTAINIPHYGDGSSWSHDLSLNISGNEITGFDHGLSIYDKINSTYGSLPVGSDININHNDLSGNALYGLAYGTGEIVDASCNWWGSNTAGGVAAEVSGDVQFLAYSTVANPTNCNGLGPVNVHSTSPTSPINWVSSHMSIQDAIDATTTINGYVVEVDAGTYIEESIIIDKSLTLQGVTEAGVIIAPFAQDDWNGGTSSQYGVEIAASNVVVKNLTVNGRGNVALNPTENNFHDGIRTNGFFGNITVQDVTVKNILRRGINIWGDNNAVVSSDNTVTGCTIENIMPPTPQGGIYAITMPAANGTASNNIVTGAWNGIALWWKSNTGQPAIISGNTLTNIGVPGTSGETAWISVGIQFSAPGGDKRKVTITGNSVSDIAGSGQVIGYRLVGANNQTLISGNTANLVNSEKNIALYLYGSEGNTVQTNNFTVAGKGQGIFFSVGTSGVPVPSIVTGNTITAVSSTSTQLPEGSGIVTTNDKSLDIGFPYDNHQNVNNTVTGNTITGFVNGILVHRNPALIGTVEITTTGNTIANGTHGITVQGSGATLLTGTIGASIFSGQSENYIQLISNAGDIDAGTATFDGLTGLTATLAQNFDIEDKIVHKIDNDALGFVKVNDLNTYVTENSFVAPATTTPSIQRSIDAASSGWTVNVNEGIYNESPNISKAVVLLGANRGISANDPADPTLVNPARGAESLLNGTFTLQADDITIDGFAVTGAGFAIQAIEDGVSDITLRNNNMYSNTGGRTVEYWRSAPADSWTISDNRITDVQASNATAITLFNISDLTITNNTILHTNSSYEGRRGMNIDGGQTVLISGNYIDLGLINPIQTPPGYPNFYAARYPLQISQSDRTSTSVVIENNILKGAYDGIVTLGNNDLTGLTIENNTMASSIYGIRFRAGSNSVGNLQSEVDIIDNNFTNISRRTIMFGTSDANVFDDISITGNSLTGNGELEVYVQDDVSLVNQIDATCNWWGTEDPYAIAPVVSGDVQFLPFLVVDNLSGTTYPWDNVDNYSCDGYGPVIVYVGNTATVRSSHMTIQAAIDEAVDGDDITVADGIYIEQVHVTTPNLSVTGESIANTIIRSPATLTQFFTTNADNYPIVFVDGGDGFVLKNLTVDGDHQGNANYKFQGIGYWNAGGTMQDLKVINVMDNPFSGSQHGVGVYTYNNTGGPYTFVIDNVDVEDFQKNAFAINGNGLSVTMNNCDVVGYGDTDVTAQNGIQLYGTDYTAALSKCTVDGINYTGTGWSASGVLVYFVENLVMDSITVSNSYTSFYNYGAEDITLTNSTVNSGRVTAFYTKVLSPTPSRSESEDLENAQPFGDFTQRNAERGSGINTVSISNCEFTGSDNTVSKGIAFSGNAGTSVNASIQNCKVWNMSYAIVGWDYGATASVSINNNSFENNTVDIYNPFIQTYAATCNWYNTSDPIAIASKIGGPALFLPFLTSGADGSSDIGFQPTGACDGYGPVNVYDATFTTHKSSHITIQSAIDESTTGNTDVIEVQGGTYTENVTVNKEVEITGISAIKPTIDGNASGTVVTILTNNVALNSFNVQNSGAGNFAGVALVGVSNCSISDNTITANQIGVAVLDDATDNIVVDNTISSNTTYGVLLDYLTVNTTSCTLNTVETNTITGSEVGIYLGETATANTLLTNTVQNNSLHGIEFYHADNNTIDGNTIDGNTQAGIRLSGSQNNRIVNNILTGGTQDDGIRVFTSGATPPRASTGNVVADNSITDHAARGLVSDGASVDAEYNWWGDEKGPRHATNPCGLGDLVSDYVDFSPWYYNVDMEQDELNGLPLINLSDNPDMDAVVDVPIIITSTVSYPEDVSNYDDDILHDALIEITEAMLSFPAGAQIIEIKLNGGAVPGSFPFALGGVSAFHLSDVIGPAYPLNVHGTTNTWEITIIGFGVVEDYDIRLSSVSYLDKADCNNILAIDEFTIDFNVATFDITEAEVSVCGPVYETGFESTIQFPAINKLDMDILANNHITTDIPLPSGTVIDWNYNNGAASGSYTLTAATDDIYLSTIVNAPPTPLQGHSGTDTWQIDITVGAQASYVITAQPVAQLDGTDYPYGGFDVVDVHFITQPTANAGSGGEVCLDADFSLTAVASIGTGLWTQVSGPAGGTATFDDPNIATTTVGADLAGEYTLRWTETNAVSGNDCVAFDEVVVKYNPLPEPVISGLLSVCAGSTGVGYSTPLVAGDQYLWSVSGGTIASGQGTNSITVDWLDVSPGTVSVTQYAAVTFCSASVSENVTLIALPDPVIAGNETPTISTTETYSTTSLPFHAYTWTVSGGIITSGQGSASITVDWPGTPGTGTVALTALNLQTGCVGMANPLDITITVGGVTVSGYFTYHNNANTPLVGLSLSLMQGVLPIATATTVAGGYYEFTNVPDGNYTIEATTTLTPGGVNSLDAGSTNLWWTNAVPIERVTFQAGDVNENNHIQGTDAGQIQGHFLNIVQFNNDWTFGKQPSLSSANPLTTDPSITVSGADLSQDYYGRCVGDFNGNFTPSSKAAGDGDVDLILEGNLLAATDVTFELPIKVTADMQVAAFSLILNLPAYLVSVEDVYIQDGNNQIGNFDYNVIGDELRIGWNALSAVSFSDDQPLLTLKLRTTENFGNGEIIQIGLKADPLNQMADGEYNVIEDAVLSTYTVEYSTTGIGEFELSESTSLSCYPNPFTDVTNINYSIPVEGKVVLEIYDTRGAHVGTLVNETLSRGDYTVQFDRRDKNAGLYNVILRVKANDHIVSKTIKVVMNTN